MKKVVNIALAVAMVIGLSACTGSRGYNGSAEVCTNDYLLGVISIAEMVAPCKK